MAWACLKTATALGGQSPAKPNTSSIDFAEQLLRFCASGKSAYIACSPCCSEYSRLKLHPGPGPKPLRTPFNLGGVPGLNSAETARLQNSFLQLSRGVQCLQVGFLRRIPWPPGTTSQCNVLGRGGCPGMASRSEMQLCTSPSM